MLQVLSEHAEEQSGATSSSPTPHPPLRTATDMSEAQLGTIHETGTVDSTYPQGDTATGFNSRSDYVTSPSKQMMSSMSPYGFSASIAGQNLEKAPSIVPITPAPTSVTEDSWPNIDERDYMRTPDKSQETVMGSQQTELPAPVAPPPSPEPRDPNSDYDFQPPEVCKSTTLSLTPLAEEEEEDDHVKDNRGTDETYQQVPPAGGAETEKSVVIEEHVDKEEVNENKALEEVDEVKLITAVEAGALQDGKIDEKTTGVDSKPDVVDHTKEVTHQDSSGAVEATEEKNETLGEAENQQMISSEPSPLDNSVTPKIEAIKTDVVSQNETMKTNDSTANNQSTRTDVTTQNETTKPDDVTPQNETTKNDGVTPQNEKTKPDDITPKNETTRTDDITVMTTRSNDVMPKTTDSGDVTDDRFTKESQPNDVETKVDMPNLTSESDPAQVATITNSNDTNIQSASNIEERQQIDSEQKALLETEAVENEVK